MFPTHRRALIPSAIVVALVAAALFLLNPFAAQSPAEDGVYALSAPAIVAAESPSGISLAHVLDDEAGISAYFHASAPFELDDVRDVYRTIEAETSEYIIGSVPVLDYDESHDVHLFVSADGWFLAYYHAEEPTAKIFDWKTYNSSSDRSNVDTRFEIVLADAAGVAAVPYTEPTYYHFKYADATHMMLIVEDWEDGNAFTIELPTSYTFSEMSWGLHHKSEGSSGYWKIDGQTVEGANPGTYYTSYRAGFLSGAELTTGERYEISVRTHGGLALLYRVN